MRWWSPWWILCCLLLLPAGSVMAAAVPQPAGCSDHPAMPVTPDCCLSGATAILPDVPAIRSPRPVSVWPQPARFAAFADVVLPVPERPPSC